MSEDQEKVREPEVEAHRSKVRDATVRETDDLSEDPSRVRSADDEGDDVEGHAAKVR